MAREIQLTQGKVAIVDDEDYERVMRHKWHVVRDNRTWYARTFAYENGHLYMLQMARMLFALDKGDKREVDHIDGDGLNNRRGNLRICTHAENARNTRLYRKSTSHYRGVCWYKKTRQWRAEIQACGKALCIGYFNREMEAALAYDLKAMELHKEFARTNFF